MARTETSRPSVTSRQAPWEDAHTCSVLSRPKAHTSAASRASARCGQLLGAPLFGRLRVLWFARGSRALEEAGTSASWRGSPLASNGCLLVGVGLDDPVPGRGVEGVAHDPCGGPASGSGRRPGNAIAVQRTETWPSGAISSSARARPSGRSLTSCQARTPRRQRSVTRSAPNACSSWPRVVRGRSPSTFWAAAMAVSSAASGRAGTSVASGRVGADARARLLGVPEGRQVVAVEPGDGHDGGG